MTLDTINWLLGGPLVLYAVVISVICTVSFNFVQFTQFFNAWRALFNFEQVKTKSEMTPFDAFLNTLSANLGNGSIAGAAVAVYTGGPGAALWVMIIGMLLMAVRFAEIYASTLAAAQAPANTVLGGPMLYLRSVIGGKFLSPFYGIICLVFSLLVGNAMQSNSISLSLKTTWGINPYMVAIAITVFIGYVVLGGAHRIIAVSDRIVPIKVVVFFVSSFIIIFYYLAELIPALTLIAASAFKPESLAGGVVGFTVMQAVQSGMNLSLTATESGLGTAAILFGYTGSKDPMRSALMGMMSTFISSLVCFMVALCIVMTGVWSSGLTSTALTIASYNTVFGIYGGWLVSFLSISFGVGVLVAFAYVARAAWLSVTNGKYANLFPLLYGGAAFFGAIMDVKQLFQGIAIINGTMLAVNIFGLLCLAPVIRAHMLKR